MQILKLILSTAALSTTMLMSIGHAAPHAPVHTWHTVSTSQGVWEAKLQMLNEDGWFVDTNGATLNGFTIDPEQMKTYGFGFAAGSDFDITYTLTIINKDQTNNKIGLTAKACVYLVTATGPAQPDIRVSSFNGATCHWKVIPGIGEDFMVS